MSGCSRQPIGPRDDGLHLLPALVQPLNLSAFRNGRPLWVYLPPGYARSTARYPVLYLNDGDNVVDANGTMHAGRIVESLIRRGEIEPIIMVGISSGSTIQRYLDYTPWPRFDDPPQGGGDAYLAAIRDTLKPEIDRRYRTLRDREHTGIAGLSLSGLISTYALFKFDATFGKAGAFSPSYWWAPFELRTFIRAHGKPASPVLLYEDTGSPDDNDLSFWEPEFIRLGFVPGVDFMSYTVEGADHDVGAWAHRLPRMLKFLFPRRR